jgi:hypothetical protein
MAEGISFIFLNPAECHLQLNLDLRSFRRNRLRQTPEVTVTSKNRIHGTNTCIKRVPESSNSRLGDSGIISGNVMPQHVQENQTTQNLGPSSMLALSARSFAPDGNVPALPLVSQQQRYQMRISPRSMQDQGSGSPANISGAAAFGQDKMVAHCTMNSAALLGKRENQDAQMSPLSSFSKRPRLTPAGPDVIQQQQRGLHMDGLHESEMNRKNSLLQQQAMTRGIQYANAGIQKYPHQMLEGVVHQNAAATSFSAGHPGMRLGLKEEQFETEKLDGSVLSQGKNDMQMMETETGHLETQQPWLQQRLPQPVMRSNFPQAGWNNLSQDCRKEEQPQKRKPAQSPRLSTGGLAQSPLSSKSGELSSGSVGPHFGAAAATAALGSSQKEKSVVTAVGGTPSLTSSANDSLQRQHQVQVAAKRRLNSLPKTLVMSNVGSPASVSNTSIPLNANSPSIGTPPMADQSMLERFAKIEMVTMRYKRFTNLPSHYCFMCHSFL